MTTIAFMNGNMIMNMCMGMYMCFLERLSAHPARQGKRRCTAV